MRNSATRREDTTSTLDTEEYLMIPLTLERKFPCYTGNDRQSRCVACVR